MDVNEAKLQLEMPDRTLQNCENYVSRTGRNWRRAEESSVNNRVHCQLQDEFGNDYRRDIEAERDQALKEFKEARVQQNIAKDNYDKAMAAS